MSPRQQEELRIEYVPLNDLVRWPRNPKDHDLGSLSQSFQRFGYVNPIMIDEGTGRMVAGHGRVDLLWHLKSSGEAVPDRIRVDGAEWFVPVIRGIHFRNEREAEAYLIADNQLVMLGGWHDAELYEMLKRHSEDDSLDGTGFDTEDLDDLHKRLMEGGALEAEQPQDEAKLTFDVFSKEQIVEHAFAHFRRTGFPYRRLPLHTQMIEIDRLAAFGDDPRALRTSLGHLIADTYHPQRMACSAANMRSPLDSFEDDEQLRRAIGLHLDNGQTVGEGYFVMLSLVAGTQACSNFRPGIAMHYYRRYGRRGGIVLDPCTGYGGRIVGWLASQLGGQYIGVDPNTATHAANERMVAALAGENTVSLINAPFEDVDLSNLVEQVDCIVTSPPYFAKELYSDEATQSYQRYRTIDEWGDGFLRVMLRGCYESLKPNHMCCINIADVTLRNRTFPLEEMTKIAARDAGFNLVGTEDIQFGHHFGAGGDNDSAKTEPMFLFHKPEAA